MPRVFADTSYLQALADPTDKLHDKAVALSRDFADYEPWTSHMVLVETLNAFSRKLEALKRNALDVIGDYVARAHLVRQTTEQFDAALVFYRRNVGRRYSLTDCGSMQIMRRNRIHVVLSHDQNFEEEGFVALMRH